ncbi:hypothetical protein ACWDBF_19520 [Streptomyces angustmyceticus]
MVRVERGRGARGRPVRAALLLGLLLLVGVHLVGALHGPGFLGPYTAHSAAVCGEQAVLAAASGDDRPPARLREDGPGSQAQTPAHAHAQGRGHGRGHEHGHDDGVTHAVDRLRAGPGQPAAAPHTAVALPAEPVAATAAPASPPGRPRGSPPRTGDGRSALALHCVWRQ